MQWKVDDTTTVPIQITYDPGKMTMASQEIPLDDPTISLGNFWKLKLTEYVVDWDLMDDNGQKLPISEEGFAQMETGLVQAILVHIQDDNRPNL